MKFNTENPCVTRAELVQLSAFKLPAAAVKHLPRKEREAARTIPGLTVEMVRTCERYGLFDRFRFKGLVPHGSCFFWTRRKRGETRLYSVLDVAIARLVAWGRASGLTMRELALLIRGASEVRALIAADGAESVYAYRYARGFDGCVVPYDKAGLAMHPIDPAFGQEWTFPIAWLGLNGNLLPKIQKMREVQPEVWRHSWVTPSQVMQAERAAQAAL